MDLTCDEAVAAAVNLLREEDFRFSLEAVGEVWDVYRLPGDGTVALRIAHADTPEATLVIGLAVRAHLDEDAVAEVLAQRAPS